MATLTLALVAMFFVFLLLTIAILGLFYLVSADKLTASDMSGILPKLVGTGGVSGAILMILYWVRPKR